MTTNMPQLDTLTYRYATTFKIVNIELQKLDNKYHFQYIVNTQNMQCRYCCAKLICSDTNCCVHNPGYHTYYDTNSWEIRRSPPMTSSTSWDRLSRAHKMNTKKYKKNTQFNVLRPKLGLRPQGENLREFY